MKKLALVISVCCGAVAVRTDALVCSFHHRLVSAVGTIIYDHSQGGGW